MAEECLRAGDVGGKTQAEIEIEYSTSESAFLSSPSAANYAHKAIELEELLDNELKRLQAKDFVRVTAKRATSASGSLPRLDGHRKKDAGGSRVGNSHPGAFEVTLRCPEAPGLDNLKVWSTLQTKRLPDFQKLASDVAAFLAAAAKGEAPDPLDFFPDIDSLQQQQQQLTRSASLPAGSPWKAVPTLNHGPMKFGLLKTPPDEAFGWTTPSSPTAAQDDGKSIQVLIQNIGSKPRELPFKDAYMSISVGEVLKFSQLVSSQAIQVPKAVAEDCQEGKIKIYRRVAGPVTEADVSIAPPDQEIFQQVGEADIEVDSQATSSHEQKVTVPIAARFGTVRTEDQMRFKVAIVGYTEEDIVAAQANGRSMKIYMRRHNLEDRLRDVMQELVSLRPQDPFAFVAAKLRQKTYLVDEVAAAKDRANAKKMTKRQYLQQYNFPARLAETLQETIRKRPKDPAEALAAGLLQKSFVVPALPAEAPIAAAAAEEDGIRVDANQAATLGMALLGMAKAPARVVLLLDHSKSAKAKNFDSHLQPVACDFVQEMSAVATDTFWGVCAYGLSRTLHEPTQDLDSLNDAIANQEFGLRSIARAMRKASKLLEKPGLDDHHPKDAAKIIMNFTTGKPENSEDAAAAFEEIKACGIIVIGVSTGADMAKEFVTRTSSPGLAFHLGGVSILPTFMDVAVTCMSCALQEQPAKAAPKLALQKETLHELRTNVLPHPEVSSPATWFLPPSVGTWSVQAHKRTSLQSSHIRRREIKTQDRGISIQQLVDLLDKVKLQYQDGIKDERSGEWIDPMTANLYHINKHIVKPETKDLECSYVEFVTDVEKPTPRWMVSHTWSTPLAHTVRMLKLHASSRKEDKVLRYWICAFSNNQHRLDEELQSKGLMGTPFAAVLLSEECRGTVLLSDQVASPFKRVWCVFEVEITSKIEGYMKKQAKIAKKEHYLDVMCMADKAKGAKMARTGDDDPDQFHSLDCGAAMLKDTHGGNFDQVIEEGHKDDCFPLAVMNIGQGVRIEEAKASQEKDRNAILNHIAGIENCWHENPPEKSEKYEALNKYVHSIFASVRLHVIAVQKPDDWQQCMITELRNGADPNKTIRSGCTVLHVIVGGVFVDPSAVKTDDPETIRKMLEFLIDNKADPNIIREKMTVLDIAEKHASDDVRSILEKKGAKTFKKLDTATIQMDEWSLGADEGLEVLAKTLLSSPDETDSGANSTGGDASGVNSSLQKRIEQKVKDRMPDDLKAKKEGLTLRLSLARNAIGESARHLQQVMWSPGPKLESLVLDENPALAEHNSEGLKHIMDAFTSATQVCNLRVLSLRACNLKLEDDTGQKFVEALKSATCSLTDLTLSENEIKDSAGAEIFSALKLDHCQLKRLNMSNNELGDVACKTLIDAMKARHTVNARRPVCEVALSNNFITGECAASLYHCVCDVHAYGSSKRWEFVLNHTDPEVSSARKNRSVQVGDAFLECLVRYQEKSTPSELHLAGNAVTEAGVAVLAKECGEGKISTLESLDLAHQSLDNGSVQGTNNLWREAAKHIADAMKQQWRLTNLRLDGNAIGDAGASALAEALSHKDCVLKKLSLERNGIGDDGACKLAEALRDENCKLEELWLDGNDMTADAGGRMLMEAAKREESKMLCLDLPWRIKEELKNKGNGADSAEQRAEKAEQRAERAEQRAKSAEQRAESAEQRAEGAEQRAEGAEQRAEIAEQRAKSAEQRADSAEKQAAKAEEKAKQFQKQIRSLEEKAKQLEDQIRSWKVAHQVNAARTEQADADRRAKEAEEKVRQLEEEIRILEAGNVQASQHLFEVKTARGLRARAEEHAAQAEDKARQLQQQNKALEEQLRETAARLAEANTQITDKTTELEKMAAKVNAALEEKASAEKRAAEAEAVASSRKGGAQEEAEKELRRGTADSALPAPEEEEKTESKGQAESDVEEKRQGDEAGKDEEGEDEKGEDVDEEDEDEAEEEGEGSPAASTESKAEEKLKEEIPVLQEQLTQKSAEVEEAQLETQLAQQRAADAEERLQHIRERKKSREVEAALAQKAVAEDKARRLEEEIKSMEVKRAEAAEETNMNLTGVTKEWQRMVDSAQGEVKAAHDEVKAAHDEVKSALEEKASAEKQATTAKEKSWQLEAEKRTLEGQLAEKTARLEEISAQVQKAKSSFLPARWVV